MTYFRQCDLVRTHGEVQTYQTAWIPEQFAVPGKHLKISGVNGWQVVKRGFNRKPEALPCADEHRYHRSVTDV